jgi:hypothetical protein
MAEPLTAADRAEILELLARYSWTLDTGDLQGCIGLFTEDGVFDGASGYFCGKDALLTFAERVHAGPHAAGLQHWTGNSVFETREPNVTVRSMSCGLRRGTGEHTLVFVGYYIDTFERVDGTWLFKTRRWRPWDGGAITASSR